MASKSGNKKKKHISPEKAEAAKAANKSKKIRTGLIVAAAIAAVAAAAALAVFVIKPLIEKRSEPAETTTVQSAHKDEADNVVYKEVDYKGTKMPDIFADILNSVEDERSAVNKEYGTVATVCGRSISVPEYVYFYHNRYCTLYNNANSQMKSEGVNKTGLDTKKTPMNQTDRSSGNTLAKIISDYALEQLQSRYATFEAAIAAGTVLTQAEVNETVALYENILTYANNGNKEVSQLLAEQYTDGLSYPMLQMYNIMESYTLAYQARLEKESRAACTEQKQQAEFAQNGDSYYKVNIRIAPIEDLKPDASLAAKVHDEQSYFDYVKSENGAYYSEYDPELDTLFFAVNAKTITDEFGEAIAAWAFDPERKSGDTALVKGGFYECMLYMITPKHLTYSMDYRALFVPFNASFAEDATDAEKAAAKESAEKYLAQWQKGDKTEDSFAQLCKEHSAVDSASDGGLYDNVRTGTVETLFDKWCTAEGRKKGDVEIVEISNGYALMYFISINKDDPDWTEEYIASAIADDYEKYTDALLAKDEYKISVNENGLTKSIQICEALAEHVISANSSTQASTTKQ